MKSLTGRGEKTVKLGVDNCGGGEPGVGESSEGAPVLPLCLRPTFFAVRLLVALGVALPLVALLRLRLRLPLGDLVRGLVWRGATRGLVRKAGKLAFCIRACNR